MYLGHHECERDMKVASEIGGRRVRLSMYNLEQFTPNFNLMYPEIHK